MAAHLAGLTLLAFIGHRVAVRTADDYLGLSPKNIDSHNAFSLSSIINGYISSTKGIMIHTPSIAGVTVCQRWCLFAIRGIQQSDYRIAHRLSRYRLPPSWYRYLPAGMTHGDRRQCGGVMLAGMLPVDLASRLNQ